MRALAPVAALLLGGLGLGCLDVRAPNLSPLDDRPPSVLSTVPAAGCDGGPCALAPGEAIEITFSERMDPRTLRPGIAVQLLQPFLVDGGRALLPTAELPVAVTIPEPTPEPLADVDVPYAVKARPAQLDGGALEAGRGYQLTLRTLLLDTQGNALSEQVEVPFVAQ